MNGQEKLKLCPFKFEEVLSKTLKGEVQKIRRGNKTTFSVKVSDAIKSQKDP